MTVAKVRVYASGSGLPPRSLERTAAGSVAATGERLARASWLRSSATESNTASRGRRMRVRLWKCTTHLRVEAGTRAGSAGDTGADAGCRLTSSRTLAATNSATMAGSKTSNAAPGTSALSWKSIAVM
jgi:hypothetical protein